MKLIKRTSTELIFRDFRVSITQLLFIGMTLFFGYIMLSNQTIVKSVVFSCQRVEPKIVNCQSKQTPLLIGKATTQKYNFVMGARYEVEQTTGSEGETLTDYYVLLITKQGEFPIFQEGIYINGVRGNPQQTQMFANRINQFLQSQQPSITLKKNIDLTSYIIQGIPFVMLIAVIFYFLIDSQDITTLKLNKKNNKIDRRYGYLFRFSINRESDNLNELQTVKVQKQKYGSRFLPVIVMESGKTYELGKLTKTKNLAINQVNLVRNFLGLDLLPVKDESEMQASLQPPMLSQLERVEVPKTYEGRASLTFLENAIAEIARQDIYAQQQQERLSTKLLQLTLVITGFYFLGLGMITVIIFTLLSSEPIKNVLPIVVVLVVLVIVGRIAISKHDQIEAKVKDYERYSFASCRHRYQVLENLIRVWKKDIQPGKKIYLQLDLAIATKASKFQQQFPHPHKKDFKINLYRDPWLLTSGYFLDGTRFQLEIIDYFQLRLGWNRKGKPRIDPYFKGFEVLLILKFPTSYYPEGLSRLENEAEAAISLPKTAILKRIEVTSEQLKLKVKLPSPNPKFSLSEGAMITTTTGGRRSYSRISKTGSVDPEDEKGSYSIDTFLYNLKKHPETTSAIPPASDEEELNQRQTLLFQTITLMFLSAYQILNLARAVSHQTSNE